MTTNNTQNDFVASKGIKSTIYDKRNNKIGNTLQLDLDNLDERPDKEFIESLNIQDVCLIFRTSENNYCIQGLRKRNDKDVWRTQARCMAQDAKHLKNGIRRDGSVLRMTSKGSKEKPELLEVITTINLSNMAILSKSHIEFYNKVFETDLYDVLPACRTIGSKIRLEKYITKEGIK